MDKIESVSVSLLPEEWGAIVGVLSAVIEMSGTLPIPTVTVLRKVVARIRYACTRERP